MAKVTFTQQSISRLKPPVDGRPAVYYRDASMPGFGIRVSKGGKRAWVYNTTVAGTGKQAPGTLASLALVPKLTVAREMAREAILKAKAGINPAAEKRQKEAHLKAEAAANSMTFAKLADAYLERHAEVNNKEGTLRETRRHLAKASEFFGDRPLRDLTEGDIAALIEVRSEKALTSKRGSGRGIQFAGRGRALPQMGQAHNQFADREEIPRQRSLGRSSTTNVERIERTGPGIERR